MHSDTCLSACHAHTHVWICTDIRANVLQKFWLFLPLSVFVFIDIYVCVCVYICLSLFVYFPSIHLPTLLLTQLLKYIPPLTCSPISTFSYTYTYVRTYIPTYQSIYLSTTHAHARIDRQIRRLIDCYRCISKNVVYPDLSIHQWVTYTFSLQCKCHLPYSIIIAISPFSLRPPFLHSSSYLRGPDAPSSSN